MRNLKKILALVLALVMSLSLMATAGASQFPDVDDSNPYKTAIDVLDELKVFQGFEDGTFKPTDTLNRAQAAVLVYRIATGDVENKYLDNYTYMAQSKFNDLDGYNWAKGYINYCQNAGIVVGTSATTFNPGAPVTGYQLLVMVLRTLGYGKAGEFTDPKGWELQTASIAESEGITKNVTTGDFGAPAPRQMVAEILFRGLLSETVQYSPLTPGGYTKSGETLGKRELGLEDIKGVVMANEFADLEDDDTLADGKTRLDVDGKVYNLDVKSELTDIGEIRHAYVQNGTKVLTTLENQGDSVVNQPENGAATKVKDLSKTNSDTQYFLNFEETAKYSSPYKIKYEMVFDTEANAEAAQERINNASGAKENSIAWAYTTADKYGNDTVVIRVIPAKDTITSVDLSNMKDIFGRADKWYNNGYVQDGAVYVGTQSNTDISDVEKEDFKYSYDKFEEEFITDKNIAIEDSDNGEWLKTIDNDGDGVAEYVFRTDFVMSVIADYNTKKEVYYVEYDGEEKRNVNDEIPKDDIVTEEELKVGDVILYTWIDGKCYVSYPEVDTAAIDKKGIDYKAKTITCGDTTYDWSGIEQEAYHYYHDVSEAQVEVNYNLYKDHFGYVRLFAEANKGFALLTDGFYATDLKKDHTYKAEIWDNTAEELVEVEVANDNFIDTELDNNNGGNTNREEGTWDRLLAFEESYPEHVNGVLANEYVTTIAAYDVNGDGVYSLSDVSNYTGRYAYTKHELDVNSFEKGSLKDKDLKVTAGHSDDNPGLNRINATDETLYYYVQYEQSTKRQHPVVVDVDTWTGYSNGSVKLADSDRAYAVTLCYRNTDNDAWLNYETAEIIVIEHEITGEKNTVLPVSLTQRLIGKNNKIGGNGFVWDSETGKWAWGEFEGDAKVQAPSVQSLLLDENSLTPVDVSDLLHFYEIDEDGYLVRIDGGYGDYNIYAGVIVTEIGTVSRSYGEIGLSEGHTDDDANDLEPEHDFYKASDNFYTIGYDRDAATDKDEMLHVPGLQNTTLYGDVASTFSADDLDASRMNRGDKVIYVTDGDGVVQSIINVTDSRMDKNYDPNGAEAGRYPGVYEDDRHSTADRYSETWSLLDLWEDIADEQGITPPTDEIDITFKFTSANPDFPGKDDVTRSEPKGTEVIYNLDKAPFGIEGWTANAVVVKKGETEATAGGTTYNWSAPSLTLDDAYTTDNITVEVTYTAAAASISATYTNTNGGTALIANNVAWSIKGGATGNMGTPPTVKYGDEVTLSWIGAAGENYTVSGASASTSTFVNGVVATPDAGETGTYSITGVIKGTVSLAIDAGALYDVTPGTVQMATGTEEGTAAGTTPDYTEMDDAAVIEIEDPVVMHGEDTTVTVTPADGYRIVEVTADATPLTPNADGTYTLSNVTADTAINVQVAWTITGLKVLNVGSMSGDNFKNFVRKQGMGVYLVETDNGFWANDNTKKDAWSCIAFVVNGGNEKDVMQYIIKDENGTEIIRDTGVCGATADGNGASWYTQIIPDRYGKWDGSDLAIQNLSTLTPGSYEVEITFNGETQTFEFAVGPTNS